MVHYFAAVQSHGSLDGYSTESPERLHIDYAKDAYRARNKKEYVRHMTVWLGRQETVAQFRSYLDYIIPLDPIPPDDEHEPYDRDYEDEMEEPAHSDSPHSTVTSSHSVAIKPGYPHMDVTALATQFKAIHFVSALSTYIRRLSPPPALPVLPNLVDHFDVYKCITILRPSNPAARFPKSVERLHATHSVPAKGQSKAVPAHFDMVLVRLADLDVNGNQHTKGTCLEGKYCSV